MDANAAPLIIAIAVLGLLWLYVAANLVCGAYFEHKLAFTHKLLNSKMERQDTNG